MPDTAERVRATLRDEHSALLAAVAACADAVVAGWGGDAATDREAVVPPLRAALRERGALDRAPDALLAAADAADLSLPAEPVAAPPYVAVASRGLVLRATTDGGRLVVTVVAFRVERDNGGDGNSGSGPRYVRAGDSVEVAVR